MYVDIVISNDFNLNKHFFFSFSFRVVALGNSELDTRVVALGNSELDTRVVASVNSELDTRVWA